MQHCPLLENVYGNWDKAKNMKDYFSTEYTSFIQNNILNTY